MPSPPVWLTPTGGINVERSDALLAATEVRGADNMLFERGVTLQRPGITGGTAIPKQPLQVLSAELGDIGIQAVAVCPANLYSLGPWPFAPVEITGPGVSFAVSGASSVDIANGVILMGYNTTGMVRWDPTTLVYTVIAAAPYRYVVGHLSRAVAARRMGAVSAVDPYAVAWSVQGDESNWTGPSSGSTVLPEATSQLTALANIRDVIVVGRRDGFHLGTETGSVPAFNWQLHSKRGTGPVDGNESATDGTEFYFVGEEDVYTFDLVNVVSIGLPIRRELLRFKRSGLRFRGCITRGLGDNPRKQYHLLPITPVGEFGQEYPHYVYDIAEKKWSRHSYFKEAQPICGWSQPLNLTESTLAFSSREFLPTGRTAQGATYIWDKSAACEKSSLVQSRALVHPSLEKDAHLTRALLFVRNNSETPVIATLNVTAELADENPEVSEDALIGPSLKWQRRWVNIETTGQRFTADLSFPPGAQVEVAEVGLVLEEAGEFTETRI